MNRSQRRGSGLALVTLTAVLVLGSTAGQASAYTAGCGQIPIVAGIPPWGFHTGSPSDSSFARGHGDINLDASTVSGIICQEKRSGSITMTVEHHLTYHSHYATDVGLSRETS